MVSKGPQNKSEAHPCAPTACLSFQMEIEGQVYSWGVSVGSGGLSSTRRPGGLCVTTAWELDRDTHQTSGPPQVPLPVDLLSGAHSCWKSPESFVCIPCLLKVVCEWSVCFGFGIP